MPANPTALLIAPVSGSTPPDVGIGVDPNPASLPRPAPY